MQALTQHTFSELHGSELQELLQRLQKVMEKDKERLLLTERKSFLLRITENTETELLVEDHNYFVIIGPHVQAEIVEHAREDARIAILLEPGAQLTYLTINDQESAPRRDILLQEDATLDWMDASLGTNTTEHAIHLVGAGAAAKYRGLVITNNVERYRTNLRIIHSASHTNSHMLTRATLLGKGIGVYRGTISILPGATRCDAYQRADTLLLGDASRMDAQPILEIQNDDVRCSHGVTLGQVDEEKLFYLESRGIRRQDAITLLVEGFFDQLLISMGRYGILLRERVLARLEAP